MSIISPITIKTIDDLVAAGYTLALNCVPCDRWVMANLEGLQAAGKGAHSFVGMKFKCSKCGEVASKQLRAPGIWPEGQSPYTTVST